MLWNDNGTITVDAPKRPKKITGTRFASILGLNRWSTPFEAWCAITRTYEKPFEDTIYTIAGKTIEPKQADFMRKNYFMHNLITPTDMFGKDYFKKTYGDFFPDSKIFGGMWDYLLVDNDKKPTTVLEMKTTKRAEDWLENIPEYYAMQAALYAYLLNVDKVVMVCSFLSEPDYEKPDEFECSIHNTIVRGFKISEEYPDMEKTIAEATKWWREHVETGISPAYDEKADADILKVLRDNTLSPDTDLESLVKEAEMLMGHIEGITATVEKDEKRLKKLKELIKEASISQFRPGDKTITIPGRAYDWVTTISEKDLGYDTDAMKADGIDIEKYHKGTESSYRFTSKHK